MLYGLENSEEIKGKITETTPIFLPIGAVEAHGAHLPLITDNILAESYTQKICEKTGGYILPTMPYGQVWSLQNFSGSISISNETIVQILFEIGTSLYKQGMRIFVFVSGHLGNMEALKTCARKLVHEYPDLQVLYLFYPNIQKYANDVREGNKSHNKYIHACEIETSLMLYLSPDTVEMSKAINAHPKIEIEADFTPTRWEAFTETAVLGEAKLATREKGEYIINKTMEHCIEMIENMIERNEQKNV